MLPYVIRTICNPIIVSMECLYVRWQGPKFGGWLYLHSGGDRFARPASNVSMAGTLIRVC